MVAALLGAIRNTIKLKDLQDRLDFIENEIDLLEKKVQNQHTLEQRGQFENEKTNIEDQLQREEEFNHASSFIGNVVYTPEMQTMEISISSRVYPYCGVPQRIYDGFKGAPSKGVFFNRSIKGIFEC